MSSDKGEAEVIRLATKTTTPDGVLLETMERGLTDVLVLGYTPEGRLCTRASAGVTRREALWLVESARMFILTGGEDDDSDGDE